MFRYLSISEVLICDALLQNWSRGDYAARDGKEYLQRTS